MRVPLRVALMVMHISEVPKFQTLLAALVCSFTLCTHAAVPPAQAGILAFLGRHLLGNSPQNPKKKVVYRSTHRSSAAESAQPVQSWHSQPAQRYRRDVSRQT